MVSIKPPSNPSPIPDKYTEKEPVDQTGPKAPGRVFLINFGFVKYGSTDKAHGAAVLLSLILLIIILIVICIGFKIGFSPWLDRVFTWLGSAFLFLAGVAVGRSPPSNENQNEKNA
jgi:arginine exporter protein ArgO